MSLNNAEFIFISVEDIVSEKEKKRKMKKGEKERFENDRDENDQWNRIRRNRQKKERASGWTEKNAIVINTGMQKDLKIKKEKKINVKKLM